MSYILDALKKAERDRLRADPKELDDFSSSSWDPYQQTTQTNLTKYLVIAVGALMLLLGLVIYSSSIPRVSSENSQITLAKQEVLGTHSGAGDESNSQQSKVPETPIPSAKMSLPQLTISGHIFIAEGSPSNRLFASQRTLREGDIIDQGWTLVAIKLQGYEISFEDRIEMRPYR